MGKTGAEETLNRNKKESQPSAKRAASGKKKNVRIFRKIRQRIALPFIETVIIFRYSLKHGITSCII